MSVNRALVDLASDSLSRPLLSDFFSADWQIGVVTSEFEKKGRGADKRNGISTRPSRRSSRAEDTHDGGAPTGAASRKGRRSHDFNPRSRTERRCARDQAHRSLFGFNPGAESGRAASASADDRVFTTPWQRAPPAKTSALGVGFMPNCRSLEPDAAPRLRGLLRPHSAAIASMSSTCGVFGTVLPCIQAWSRARYR